MPAPKKEQDTSDLSARIAKLEAAQMKTGSPREIRAAIDAAIADAAREGLIGSVATDAVRVTIERALRGTDARSQTATIIREVVESMHAYIEARIVETLQQPETMAVALRTAAGGAVNMADFDRHITAVVKAKLEEGASGGDYLISRVIDTLARSNTFASRIAGNEDIRARISNNVAEQIATTRFRLTAAS